jgi:hypothetical protein
MWNLLVRLDGDATCPDCGAELKPERRRPGRTFARKGAERRNLAQGRTPLAKRRPSGPRTSVQ